MRSRAAISAVCVHGSLSAYGAYANARAAVLISNNGRNWTPWVTWNTGAYQGKC